jgi:cobalamin-dependent methionine synthase I
MPIDFTYLMQPPKKYTFEMPEVRLWTERWCSGRVLNLFAGMTLLGVDEVRVDIDENAPADYHEDAFKFVKRWEGCFDTVIFDPPYNLRKAREKYGKRYVGSLTKIKEELPRILVLGGRVISFGYDSVGMSRKRGFEKIAICLVCHSGDHNDTIGIVEQYTQPCLSLTT